MSIWGHLFGWKNVASWTFVAWAESILLASVLAMIGIGVSIPKNDTFWFKGAIVCFSLLSLLFLIKVGEIAVVSNHPFWERAIFSFVIFGVVGVVTVEVMRGIKSLEPPQRVSETKRSLPLMPPSATTEEPSTVTTSRAQPIREPVRPERVGAEENQRRRDLLAKLRQKYILSHDGITPGMMAGLEQPPADWLNDELAKMGEHWRIPIPKPTLPSSRESSTVTPGIVGPDVHALLVSGKLALGWTLHKRRDSLSIYCIMATDQLNAAMVAAIDRSDLNIPSELTAKTKALWADIHGKVPAPKPVETEYGEVRGQEFVEHVVHYLERKPNTLEWNYEVLANGTGITPPSAEPKNVQLEELSPESRDTIKRLDALAVHTVNRRYVDAMVRISK